MDKIKEIIEVMYDEKVPMQKLGELKPDFTMSKDALQVALFNKNPTTPEESAKMVDNSILYIERLLAAEVLAVKKGEKDAPVMLIAGPKFNEFNAEVKKYTDQDAIIIRTLGVSRQDFDEIVNEYSTIVKEATSIDDILEKWETLDIDTKKGIIRGVLFQRTIMGEVLNHMQVRMQSAIKHQTETVKLVQQQFNK
jgi:hypothetical protein